jgi:hypothetical protein
MAGDLEDFLRRAAQRRQQKAQQQKQQQAAPTRGEPPQYSDRRTERITRPVELDEPVLTAEIVEDDLSAHIAQLHRAEQASHAAKQAKLKAQRSKLSSGKGKAESRTAKAGSSGVPARDLIHLLRRPGGVQQAILLREILDRPEHRW